MLTELYCDKFKLTAPSPIKFNSGLNIVLGTANASNSIGKSTFLMMLDFVYGGEDYLNHSKDVIANVGHHTVAFTFCFGGQTYRFARSTEHKQEVYRIDDSNSIIETMSIVDYRDFLLRQYGLDNTGLSWRDCVSGTFRIWQRDNDKPTLPLATHRSDTHQNGIRRLLGLFGQLLNIDEALDKEIQLQDAINAAKSALRAYNYDIAQTRDEYEKNESRIKELKVELEKLRSSLEMSDENQLSSDQSDALAALKRLMIPLKRRRTILENQKNSLLDMGVYETPRRRSANFSDLVEFFPDINIEKLQQIEAFHQGLKKIMHKQIAKTQSSIEEELDQVNHDLEKLAQMVADITQVNPEKVSLKAAISFSEINGEIAKLVKANKGYDQRKEYREELRKLREELDASAETILPEIQNRINTYLREVDGSFTDSKRNPPEIRLEKIDKYSYAIADDTGTGSGYRSLLSFDLALLENSALPVVIEDSMLFKQIETTAVNRILKRYQGITEKQIFIALDEAEKYDGDTRVIIEENTVLHLDEGSEALFGREWAKK